MSTLTAAVDLRPVPASVPVARHLVLDLLGAWKAPHDAGDAALLVTELVANVVDHVAGEASFTLELSLSEDWLRISVVDGSALRLWWLGAGNPVAHYPYLCGRVQGP